jgi:hypothetical protein
MRQKVFQVRSAFASGGRYGIILEMNEIALPMRGADPPPKGRPQENGSCERRIHG